MLNYNAASVCTIMTGCVITSPQWCTHRLIALGQCGYIEEATILRLNKTNEKYI